MGWWPRHHRGTCLRLQHRAPDPRGFQPQVPLRGEAERGELTGARVKACGAGAGAHAPRRNLLLAHRILERQRVATWQQWGSEDTPDCCRVVAAESRSHFFDSFRGCAPASAISHLHVQVALAGEQMASHVARVVASAQSARRSREPSAPYYY